MDRNDDSIEGYDTVTLGDGPTARVYNFPRTPPPAMSDDEFRIRERGDASSRRSIASMLRLLAQAIEQGDIAKYDDELPRFLNRGQLWRTQRDAIDRERVRRAAHLRGVSPLAQADGDSTARPGPGAA